MSLEVKEATLTLYAGLRGGRSTIRTSGYVEYDSETPELIRFIVEQNTQTSRFLAANYGRTITIEATPH